MSGPVSDALDEVAKKTEQSLAKDFSGAYHDILKDTEDKTGQIADQVADNESSTVEHVHQIHEPQPTQAELRAGLGETPVYRMKDNKVIERLTPDGPAALTDEDREILGDSLNLNSHDAVGRPPRTRTTRIPGTTTTPPGTNGPGRIRNRCRSTTTSSPGPPSSPPRGRELRQLHVQQEDR
ncbi:hypothetical protein GXW82_09660 [Streptacidiphilus sp. 4-A2]|nr:hypothetical protein [Streptacidiphilus sp. 4-A2]